MQCKTGWIALAISAVLVVNTGCKKDSSAATESSANQSSTAKPAVAAPPAVPVPNVKIVSVVIRKVPNMGGQVQQYVTTVTNSGTTSAKVDGSCNYTCPAGSLGFNGKLRASNGEFVAAGATQTLASESAALCFPAKSGIQLQCTYNVQATDSSGQFVGQPLQLTWNGEGKVQ
ncbi:MAG TPA: hypothetical protein VGL22_13860 [Terracidiphilus sp.]|jgi:hypothetical protein